jgi:putative RNA 2'-phosphotransferase
MSKKNLFKSHNVGHIMAYVLAHRPFEFGIVPDGEGFVTYKELLQALHEEPGWGYVKEGNIREVLMGEDRSLFEADTGRIRATDRKWAFDESWNPQLPAKLLYLAIRRKAHSVVMEKGLSPLEGHYYILSPGREMAERIGRRRDPEPVLLEIMAEAAQNEGVVFRRFGDLFLAHEMPMRFIAGPPVPRSVIKARQEKEAKKQEQAAAPQFQPGTFILDIERDPHLPRKDKGRKKRSWKEAARKDRRTMRINPW